MECPTTESFKSVSIVDPNNGWAVGWNGVIIRWDGTKWNNVTIFGSWNSLDMLDSTDGWAVGPAGSIILWDGTSWSRVECPINSPLESVDMVGSTYGWAVGDGEIIIRWDGKLEQCCKPNWLMVIP